MRQANRSRPRARLITTAWGDRYVAELFDITLAAALAPGNLPWVVEQLECDVVILTEASRFDQLREHPVFRGLARLCPVELRPVDEFVTRADAYGMALTYALFRGFEDLGEDMVNVHMLFINSDFVLADGAFRTVARKILDGERLILAPSYCVVGEVVGPELERWRDSATSAITAPPRELAALGIANRHNTIRGKTLNQQLFSMEWIDQFYWLVDQETMLARQLPIAVVSMRPERVLTEMVTFWDYGIISWACPNTPRCVIADSDDFLMIELRGADTARDQIRLGRPSKEQIARKLYRFITADPLELSRHTLIWHSADLPDNLAEAEAELDRYVSSVVSYLPTPVDYYNHYIWAYHYPTFQKLRGAYLASQGRPLTWDVDALVEYPPHPPTEVFDAAFVAASNGRARQTAALIALEQETPGALAAPVRAPRSEAGIPNAKPVRSALENRGQGRVLVLNSRSLPVRLLGAVRGLPIEFDGLPAWIDAYLSEDPAEAHAPARPSRFSVEDSCDLCLCEIDTPDLLHVRELLATLSLLMYPGSKIYLFYVNPEAGTLTTPAELIASDALAIEFPARVSFVGMQPGSLAAPDSAPNDAGRTAFGRTMLNFVRQASDEGATDSQLAAFDEPPDRCLGMIVEIDVTLRHAGPFLVIKRRATRGIRTRTPIDLRPQLLAAGQRAATELGSKLASLSAERDTLAAQIASRQADINRLAAKLASVREEKESAVADRARLLSEFQLGARRVAAERGTLRGHLQRAETELSRVRAALAGQVEEVEKHDRELVRVETQRTRQLAERDAELAALEARNRELTEAASERARQLRDREAELSTVRAALSSGVEELEARNRELTEAASERVRHLDQHRAELATVRATLSRRVEELEDRNRGLADAQSLQLQDREAELSAVRAALGSRMKELEYYNRELTEAASERARQLQERDTELATVRAALASRITELEDRSRASAEALAERARQLEERETELAGVRAAFGRKVAKLEDHNRELTEAATERARQVQEREAELAGVRAAFGDKIAKLEDHNRELTEAATDRARQLQEREAELSGVRATFGSRVQELEDHNREVTDAATDRARQLQEREAELSAVRATLTARVTELEEQNRTLNDARSIKLEERDTELAAVRAAFASRVKELEEHNQVLTEAATDRARQLQERAETDYQILMAQQQLLAGMKDADPPFLDIYERCKEFTMTSVERLYALYKSVEYLVSAGIEGDFVETGVWRGGSCMLMAETLVALGDTSRRILLFDTFEGHPKPDADKDIDVWGNRAIEEWERHAATGEPWAYVSLDEVRANMAQTGYPTDRVVFVKGMVENTVPRFNEVGPLAMMRLDTDWYRSACVTLEHFFPRLVEGGVLILDDYGHYKGQRSALDEYLEASGEHLLLNRVDYSCRVAVKGPARKFDIRQTRQSAN